MVLNVSLSSWELIVVCLMGFILFCFIQYTRARKWEAISRSYGSRRRGDVTEIHNHFYGYDEQQILNMRQLQNQGIPLPAAKQRIDHFKMEERIDCQDAEINEVVEVESASISLSDLERENSSDEKQYPDNIVSFRRKQNDPDKVSGNEQYDTPFVEGNAQLQKADSQELKVIEDISVNKQNSSKLGRQVVQIDDDPAIQSLYSSLTLPEESKSQSKDFWGIQFDEINTYIQISELYSQPEKFVGHNIALVGKVCNKVEQGGKYFLQLADPKNKAWVLVGEKAFSKVKDGDVVSFHEIQVSNVDGKVALKQLPNTPYYIFNVVNNPENIGYLTKDLSV